MSVFLSVTLSLYLSVTTSPYLSLRPISLFMGGAVPRCLVRGSKLPEKVAQRTHFVILPAKTFGKIIIMGYRRIKDIV